MTRCTILILILGSLLSMPLHADIAAANQALSRGDYQAAVKEFTRLAEAGDVKAQSYLGYMYYAGEGVERDYGQAVQWYRKAAQQGDRDAQYNLAVAYAFGNGVEPDYGQATDWYRKAAEQGHPAAQYSLGLSYARGEGVQQDREAAVEWFRKAAAQGYADADKALAAVASAAEARPADTDTAADMDAGAVQQTGGGAAKLLSMEGIEPNLPGAETPTREILDEAPRTAASAPAQDEPAVAGNLFENADTTATRQAIKQDVTPQFESMDESVGDTGIEGGMTDGAGMAAMEQSSALENANDTGLGGGMANAAGAGAGALEQTPGPEQEGAGSFLHRLFGAKKKGGTETPAANMPGDARDSAAPRQTAAMDDGGKAKQETASQQTAVTGNGGMEEGQPGLLKRLFGNSGGEENKSGKNDQAASEANTVDPALYQRGMTALQNKNYRDAAAAFHDASVQGDTRSQFRLGSLFYQGLGVTRDYGEAARWFQRAAENGNADAQYSLGNMYLMGEGVEQDDRQAAYWYQKAADQGHDSARHNLENLKRIMSRSGEHPGLAEGEVSEGASPEATTGSKKDDRGFFSRWFGKDEADKKQPPPRNANAPQPDRNTSQQDSGKDGEKPSFMSKEGGGLFGRLFGWGKDQEKTKPQQQTAAAEATGDQAPQQAAAAPAEDNSGKQPAADGNDTDDPSYMSKEGGGLLGHLFGWGKDENPGARAAGNSAAAGAATTAAVNSVELTDDSAGRDAYRKGLAFDRGDGVEQDPEQAFKWFLQAAEQGNTEAQYRVGLAYAYGKGTDNDLQQATRWYARAATGGHAIAQRNLATMYARGEGVKQDKTQALAWYSILAENGNVMDVRRRDVLVKELSAEEIANSHVIMAGLKSEMTKAASGR